MTRTTLQIQIAVKEAEPDISEEELRLCIAALSAINHFYRQSLKDLIDVIREEKPPAWLKMKYPANGNSGDAASNDVQPASTSDSKIGRSE